MFTDSLSTWAKLIGAKPNRNRNHNVNQMWFSPVFTQRTWTQSMLHLSGMYWWKILKTTHPFSFYLTIMHYFVLVCHIKHIPLCGYNQWQLSHEWHPGRASPPAAPQPIKIRKWDSEMDKLQCSSAKKHVSILSTKQGNPAEHTQVPLTANVCKPTGNSIKAQLTMSFYLLLVFPPLWCHSGQLPNDLYRYVLWLLYRLLFKSITNY